MFKKTNRRINETIESIMQERAILGKEHITIDKQKINKLKMEKKKTIEKKNKKEDSKLKKIKLMMEIKGQA